ncbi:MAG: class I SAM-dependent methyltransferase [Porticoccaceae bacterium]
MTRIETHQSHELCPVCGETGVVLGFVKGVQVYECGAAECRLWFLPKRVRPEADRDNSWYQERLADDNSLAQMALTKMLPLYRRQLGLFDKLTDGRHLVDVGSGQGYFVAAANSCGWEGAGVELSSHGRAFAKSRFGIAVVERIEEIASGTVDAVRASHVLEHIPEPNLFLAELARILRPGGALLVIVPHREPFIEMLVNRVRRCRRGSRVLSGAVYPDMHVLGFDERTLTSVVARHGLKALWTRSVSMGNSTFYPWWYDDLVAPLDFLSWVKLGPKFCIPRLVNNLGGPLGRGDWVVAMFQKT